MSSCGYELMHWLLATCDELLWWMRVGWMWMDVWVVVMHIRINEVLPR